MNNIKSSSKDNVFADNKNGLLNNEDFSIDENFDHIENFGDENFDDVEDFDDLKDSGNIVSSNMVHIPCPKCSPKVSIWHKLLKPGQNPVAECIDCGHIHSFVQKVSKKKSVKVMISRMENTQVVRSLFNEDELISVNSELIIDDDSTGESYPVLVTSIEKDDKRLPFAKAKNIDTLWARAVDKVMINISIRDHDITESVQQEFAGSHEFVVGEMIQINKKNYPIVAVKIRGGRFRKKTGDCVLAKKVKRIYTEKKKSEYNVRPNKKYLDPNKKPFRDNDWKSENKDFTKKTLPKPASFSGSKRTVRTKNSIVKKNA